MKRIENITYKDQTITVFGTIYSVFFEGDEVVFENLEEAKKFIDENF